MSKATGGNGIIQEKYVTVSVCKKNIEDARAYFARVGAELTARFAALGAKVAEMDATEKLRVLHDFYRSGEEVYFRFDAQDMMRKGHDFRDYICPDSVEKHSDYLMLGGKYARVVYLKDYASFISDQLVTKLTDQSRSMMLSIDIIPVATDEAVREVERKMLGVETNITKWQRRQNANNNFSAIVPYDMEQQRRETKEYMTDLTSRDQRMMLSVLTIVHLADTKHGISDYVLLIEAVMMQESGGRGSDPMQCSECNFNTLYPHTPGSITDPEYSINVGIQNLADCLQIAQCESPVDMDAIKLALQGYNYGQGYITWAMNKYGEYSKANAVEFSLKTAEACGWSSYGDMDYVPHVLRYYPLGQIFYDPDTSQLIVEVAALQIGNVGGEIYWRWYGFTERVEWCACFVSWCANKCGYLDTIIPKFSGCSAGVQWFKARNQWAERSVTPEPGMIIFFDWDVDGLPDHTGIVEKSENGYVYTIEGNTSDSCRRRQYAASNPQILGYGMLCP